jgi:hypothetical protein
MGATQTIGKVVTGLGEARVGDREALCAERVADCLGAIPGRKRDGQLRIDDPVREVNDVAVPVHGFEERILRPRSGRSLRLVCPMDAATSARAPARRCLAGAVGESLHAVNKVRQAATAMQLGTE